MANLDNDNNTIDETYVEVKSVTLIKDGIAQFPDAPTERGRKHLEELISLKKEDPCRGTGLLFFYFRITLSAPMRFASAPKS